MRVPSSKKRQMGRRCIVHIIDAEVVSGMLIITKLNPLEGNVTSLQEIPDGIGGRAPTLAVETDVTFGIPFLQRAHETGTIWSILG